MKTNLGYWKQESVFGSPRMASNSQARKRFADRRCATQTRLLKRFISQEVDAVVALGNSFACSAPSRDPIPDSRQGAKTQDGATYCTRHRISTIGNFCAACEQEAAEARVPVRKSVATVQAVSDDCGRLVTDGGQGGTP